MLYFIYLSGSAIITPIIPHNPAPIKVHSVLSPMRFPVILPTAAPVDTYFWVLVQFVIAKIIINKNDQRYYWHIQIYILYSSTFTFISS